MTDLLRAIAIGFVSGALTVAGLAVGLIEYGTPGNLVGTAIGSATMGAVFMRVFGGTAHD